MDPISFLAGMLCGVLAMACLPLARTWARRLRLHLGEDEEFLLCAARAAGGRLIFRFDPLLSSTPLLQLKEFTQPSPLENRGQVRRLVAEGLLEQDESGMPERYVLTQKGWSRVRKLPAMMLVASRQGAWYNSVSRRPRRPLRR